MGVPIPNLYPYGFWETTTSVGPDGEILHRLVVDGGGGGVTSVNGETGDVTLTAEDVEAAPAGTGTGGAIRAGDIEVVSGAVSFVVGRTITTGPMVEVAMSTQATGFTVARRDTNGTTAVGAPTADAHAVNRGYLQAGGATGSRPASPSARQPFFDTTLGKPIWYNGTNWVDATGATV